MSQFRVGQRVRVVHQRKPEHMSAGCIRLPRPVGTIVRYLSGWPMHGECIVAIDGVPAPIPVYGGFAAFFYQLEPLTDPKADAFLDSIRKMADKPATLAEILHAKLEA